VNANIPLAGWSANHTEITSADGRHASRANSASGTRISEAIAKRMR